MSYSPEKKKEIIFQHWKTPLRQRNKKELKKKSLIWNEKIYTCRNLKNNCGDFLYLLVKTTDNYLSNCFFSGEDACLITTAAADILCLYLENKKKETAEEIIDNCQLMIKGKKTYCLSNYPKLEIFDKISNFSHRVGCVEIVLRGFKKTLC